MLLTSGTNRQWSKGPPRPERLCVLYDERPLRPDRLSAAIEQRLVAHQVAVRHQDEHHVWRKHLGGKASSVGAHDDPRLGIYLPRFAQSMLTMWTISADWLLLNAVENSRVCFHWLVKDGQKPRRDKNERSTDRWADRRSFSFLTFLICVVFCFVFSRISPPAHNTGPHRRRSDRAAEQERVRLFNVQCLVRSDRILATAEQGPVARHLAARRQDEHHLRRRDLGGIRSSIKGETSGVLGVLCILCLVTPPPIRMRILVILWLSKFRLSIVVHDLILSCRWKLFEKNSKLVYIGRKNI